FSIDAMSQVFDSNPIVSLLRSKVRSISRALAAAIPSLLICVRMDAQVLVDPRPPDHHPLLEIPVSEAKVQPELKFRAAPHPLAPNAVTHDWRTFLGPSHNG